MQRTAGRRPAVANPTPIAKRAEKPGRSIIRMERIGASERQMNNANNEQR